jgi:hypothetical protein
MAVDLAGNVSNQAGTAKVGLTVELWEKSAYEGSGSRTGSTTTDSQGNWAFTGQDITKLWLVVVVDGTKKVLPVHSEGSQQLTKLDLITDMNVDTINEHTAAAGVTIDSVKVKDGGLTTTGAIELGHASDTTIARSGSGAITVEGNQVYLAGGTDVPVTDGGTGASSLTDGGVLLGSGTSAVTAMSVLADSEMIVGNGSTDPVAESGATLRTSIGVGTGDSPQLTGIELGHATDTTITRGAAGLLEVEGVRLVTLTATQTLTNKTLTTPTIGSFANAGHTHADAAGGSDLLASIAETTTGTSAALAVTPDGLAGSVHGEKVIQMVCVDFATALTTGSKFYFHVPSTLNVDVHNVTQDDASVLSGKLTIGIGEHGSDESGGSHTIDTGEDLLATNDVLRVDIDQIGSGDPGTGLIVTLICRLP